MKNCKIKYHICGVTIETPYYGTLLVFKKCILRHSDHDYKNTILIEYQFNISDSLSLNNGDVQSVIDKKADFFLYLFNLLLINPSYLVNMDIKLDGKKHKLKSRKIEFPDRIYSFANFMDRQINPFYKNFTSHINNEGLPFFEKLIVAFDSKADAFKNRFLIPLMWFQKGCDDKLNLNRLVSFWISFNALYQNPDLKEQDAIKKYVSKNINPDFANHIFDKYKYYIEKLSTYEIALGKKDRPFHVTQELENNLKSKNKNYIYIIKLVLLSIYGLRNRIFHGSIDFYVSENIQLIEYAEIIISAFIKEVVLYYTFDKIEPEIKLLKTAQFGF